MPMSYELRVIGSTEIGDAIIVDAKKLKQSINEHINKLHPIPMALKVIPDTLIADSNIDTTSLKIGSDVMCKYYVEEHVPGRPYVWYPATITAINNDRFDVYFFDGDTRNGVQLSDLKQFINDRDIVLLEYKETGVMNQQFYKAQINHIVSKIDDDGLVNHFVDVVFLDDGIVRKNIDLSVWSILIHAEPFPSPVEIDFQVGSCVSLKLNTSRDDSLVLLEYWHGVIRSTNSEDSTYSIQFQHCVEGDFVRVPQSTRPLRF